ncbi:MAG: DUF928 domain-containing protein [Calothrix sp. MO_167.B12]|nr:DUF928 domain-containing protein [Calothrix sp. MO_167.B12]
MQIRSTARYKAGKGWKLLACSLVLSGFPLVANAQILPQTGLKSSKQVKVPKVDVPGKRESGGTRGPGEVCISGKVALLALVLPKTNIGFTTAAYPQFFWYAPSNKAQQVRFSLYKVDRKLQKLQFPPQEPPIYQKIFKPIPQSGINSFRLPKDEKIDPLAINQDYLWSVSIICNLQDTSPSSRITSYGWVRRVPLDPQIAKKLPQLSQRDRLPIYGQAGLWFNFITTLADLRACNVGDRNLLTQWQRTLTQVNLEYISQEKLLGVQKPQNCPQGKDRPSVSQTENVKKIIDRLRSLRNKRNGN